MFPLLAQASAPPTVNGWQIAGGLLATLVAGLFFRALTRQDRKDEEHEKNAKELRQAIADLRADLAEARETLVRVEAATEDIDRAHEEIRGLRERVHEHADKITTALARLDAHMDNHPRRSSA
jgi:septal ring factor EnvC (AmiA/AmiB activator)